MFQLDTGEVYSVRSCVPSYLCAPGVYRTNTSTVTTKCCTDDLCIKFNFIASSSTHIILNKLLAFYSMGLIFIVNYIS